MEWVSWLIPLVALAVWILSNLARLREEDPRQQPNRPVNRADPERPQRKPGEVDQFLEEARRRREQREARKKAAEEAARRSTLAREEPRRVTPPTPSVRSEPVRKPVPPPLPKVVVRPSAPPPVPKVDEVVVARIVTPGEPAVEVPLGTPKVARSENSAQQQLLKMLGKNDSLKIAFLVREVFDKPLCKRR